MLRYDFKCFLYAIFINGNNSLFNIYTAIIIVLLIALVYFLLRNYQRVKKQNEEINYLYEIRKTFVDADRSLIYLKDENLRYLFVNKAVEEFYQKPAKDIVGQDDYSLSAPEFSEIRRRTDLAVIAERRIIVDEVCWDKRIYETTKFPVRLPNGQIGVGAYIRDITEAAQNKKMLEKISHRNQIHINLLSHTFDSLEIQLQYVLEELIKLTDSVAGAIYLYDSSTDKFTREATKNNFAVSEESLERIKTEEQPIINNHQGLVLPVYDDNLLVLIVGLRKEEPNYDFIDIYQVTLIMASVWNAKVKRDAALAAEKANLALKENEAKLKLILDSTYEGIYGIDLEGNCTFCNKSCIKILGYDSDQELIGKNMHELIHYQDQEGNKILSDECKIISTLRKGSGIHCSDEVYWRKDGTSVEVEYFSYPQYKDGEVVGAVVTFMDITLRKKVERDIRFLSYHDYLTGLYNRRYLEEQLVNYDQPENLPISIIMGDVNGLKITNDVFGHATGDLLLTKAAEAIKDNCRPQDIIARWGGDEYLIILPNTNYEEAMRIAQNIKEQYANEEIEAIKGSISLGVDTKYQNENIYQIITNAEKRMYENKILDRRSINYSTIDSIMENLHKNNPEELSHSQNVSLLCEQIGMAMNFSEATQRRLKEAGFYHDIGKIVVDRKLLNYNRHLNDYELAEIKEHPIVGYRILNSADETVEIAIYALNHHERWDGTGYPKGLKGNDIPQISRIIAVAESYDTMINRKKMSKEAALAEIEKEAGQQFDPEITRVFLEMLRKRDHQI